MKFLKSALGASGDYCLILRLKNFLASVFFLAASYLFYTNNKYYVIFFNRRYSYPDLGINTNTLEIFKLIAVAYAVTLFFIYILAKEPYEGKSMVALKAIGKILLSPIKTFSEGLPREEKTGFLAILVKAFFTPLLLSWLFSNIAEIISYGRSAIDGRNLLFGNFTMLFSQNLFWLTFNLILFTDVIFFSAGYLFESGLLKNRIISVEPTLLGWAVTLVCYPPFNSWGTRLMPWKSTDFPHFQNQYIFLGINILILILMGIYASASVALGLKSSNLTHRGIVRKGPYRFIRHPAYVCKNMAWWLGGLPLAILSARQGFFPLVLVLLSLASWSSIYFLRAMTEERHLMSVNEEYGNYMNEVPHRFIPFVI